MTPTLFDWAGGMPTLLALTDLFYIKVHKDALIGPVFAHASPEHPMHVAHFIAEVFGGPAAYTTGGGSHFHMIHKHFGKHLTEAMRKRWVALLLETVDELPLPDDPEFRSAFVAYIEWGTRLAILNSNSDSMPIA